MSGSEISSFFIQRGVLFRSPARYTQDRALYHSIPDIRNLVPLLDIIVELVLLIINGRMEFMDIIAMLIVCDIFERSVHRFASRASPENPCRDTKAMVLNMLKSVITTMSSTSVNHFVLSLFMKVNRERIKLKNHRKKRLIINLGVIFIPEEPALQERFSLTDLFFYSIGIL